ncbi:PEPxxWA-CTERM sorting domain-containing protein [Sphingomonas sp. XXL09]|uniref:PEPxxWA-CTERM sorting domain-containing protein n=1 Tax=Sphingomonas sp. XXL09 TaxID=3457787 RepID=UPI00406BCD5A
MKTMLLALTALTTVAVAAPASAATTIYTSATAFNAATINAVARTIPASANPGSSYTLGGVTFSTTGSLLLFNDGAYGSGIAYLADDRQNMGGPNYNIAATTNALALTLGSYFGGNTFSYVVNGVTQSITLGNNRATSFLGFTSDTPINVSFSVPTNAELDVTGFTTATAAVPEPATWALMILGMGAVGFAMRRRSKVSTTLRFA